MKKTLTLEPNHMITFNDPASLGRFVSELVRQGVTFEVRPEDLTDGEQSSFRVYLRELGGQMRLMSTAWHVTLKGGF